MELKLNIHTNVLRKISQYLLISNLIALLLAFVQANLVQVFPVNNKFFALVFIFISPLGSFLSLLACSLVIYRNWHNKSAISNADLFKTALSLFGLLTGLYIWQIIVYLN